MFRASSSYNFYCAARNARLHQRRAGRNGGAWCSRHRNNRQWLQVDFGTDAYVTRVSTQGRHNSDQWVTSYYVSFSSRGQRFITYKEGRRTKVSTLLLIYWVGQGIFLFICSVKLYCLQTIVSYLACSKGKLSAIIQYHIFFCLKYYTSVTPFKFAPTLHFKYWRCRWRKTCSKAS